MTRFFLPLSRTGRCAVVTASALAAALASGCGSAGSTDAARIRIVNAATDSGIGDVLVNNSAPNGDQSYFSASSYFYVATGASAFTAIVNTQATSVTARATSYNLSLGQYYTAYLVGRPTALAADAKFSQVLVADDTKPALAAGQAAVRVIDAAPDAGGIDVLLNGAAPDPTFTNLTFQKAALVPGSTTQNQFIGHYVPVTAGALSVKVSLTGGSATLIPPTSITVLAGRSYTLLVTEPTSGTAATGTVGGTAPTYALQTTSE